MTEIQAVLCGYYGKGNGGDEALLVSMLEMLPPHVKPIVLSAEPRATSKSYGVKSYDRMNSGSVVRALKESQVLILGGGSLIQDATSIRNSIYYGGLIGLARQFGLQTIAIAQGIGPVDKPLTRWIAKRAFSNCTALSVRDPASAALLESWGLSCIIAPDPVWSLAATPVPEIASIPSPKIAVTLRSHPKLTTARLAALTTALVDLQAATGSHILLVPFQPTTDMDIARQIRAELTDNSQIFTPTDPKQLKGLFQGVELAIGMRLHSLIMAAAEGCKCWAISYDPKVSKLMTEINIPGWELEDIPTDPVTITQAWQQHLQTGTHLNQESIRNIAKKSLAHKDLLTAAINNINGKSE
ncbi:polysaccharide pyruvyl transferase CsaB [Chamaesiphon polymorphus]|uniref:Polysaccharide pyruvyl transferase CsaB n=1 Tax=Chamaesiphon polymorphus CCALA 037 TaxID=2107692 RepID=A0A2T1FHV7_9CYAN|nr:polysaccharide pyruvyl transferase CsaB [Chamaesiphon polymorphus]PSB44573.1 polysaccharide pyruvyl transferase CsaB [Chamaesiphon polymorphus CCALA 037]